nr:hypothetical protein Iba_chr12bCG19300 [Ipomoea batatas]
MDHHANGDSACQSHKHNKDAVGEEPQDLLGRASSLKSGTYDTFPAKLVSKPIHVRQSHYFLSTKWVSGQLVALLRENLYSEVRAWDGQDAKIRSAL